MPVVINKSSTPNKQPAKTSKGQGGNTLSPAVIAAVIVVVLAVIGGAYYFLMNPSPGGDTSPPIASPANQATAEGVGSPVAGAGTGQAPTAGGTGGAVAPGGAEETPSLPPGEDPAALKNSVGPITQGQGAP